MKATPRTALPSLNKRIDERIIDPPNTIAVSTPFPRNDPRRGMEMRMTPRDLARVVENMRQFKGGIGIVNISYTAIPT